MKKKLLSIVCAFFCIANVFVGCSIAPKTKGTPFSGEVVDLVEQQPRKEKKGYKFCGYFEDKDLTKRAYQTFDEIPTGYYAKYQPDRTQLFAYDEGATGYLYTPVNMEQTIYAEDYMDAIRRYLFYTYNETHTSTSSALTNFATVLGKEYKPIDVAQGAKKKNKFYDFHDETENSKNVSTENGYVKYQFKRDTKWKAYLGEAKTTDEGIKYYVVQNKYAVVVGVSSQTPIETLSIPSKIGGKKVQEISIYEDRETFPVKHLKIPSTVNNAMIYLTPHSSEQVLEKITFEEGVNSIQVCSMQTEEISIPSTAYYVDLRRPNYGANAYMEILMAEDQKITVNGGEHYYTDNGLLYTKEGDCVHQFGNRDKLNLNFDDKVRRVLRRSINGLAKNIFIPENVEYFDIGFNEWSLRYNTVWREPSQFALNSAPVFFVKSEKVLAQWLQEYLKKDVCGFYPFMQTGFKYILPDESIELSEFLETYGKELTVDEKTKFTAYYTPTKTEVEGKSVVYYEDMMLAIVEGEKICTPQYNIGEDKWVWTDGVHSFFNEEFEIAQLNDSPYLSYYEYHNSVE